jgi:hypothetical protein
VIPAEDGVTVTAQLLHGTDEDTTVAFLAVSSCETRQAVCVASHVGAGGISQVTFDADDEDYLLVIDTKGNMSVDVGVRVTRSDDPAPTLCTSGTVCDGDVAVACSAGGDVEQRNYCFYGCSDGTGCL